jgi:hypothetical protein
MKKLSITPPHFKILIISILHSFLSSAQSSTTIDDPQKRYDDAMAKYDFVNTKTGVILNTSLLPTATIESFRHKNRSQQGSPWLFEMFRRASLGRTVEV